MENQEFCTKSYILLPCPFCGSKAIQFRQMDYDRIPKDSDYILMCMDCSCELDGLDTKDNLAKEWNIRTRLFPESEKFAFREISWKGVAQALGEMLADSGPKGYYEMSPKEWYEWAVSCLDDRKISCSSEENGESS